MEEKRFPEIRDFPLTLRIAVFFFSIYCLLGPFINFGYHATKIGVGFESMLSHYMGSEEDLIPPKSPVFFFEVMHFHVWSQAVVLFVLSAIFSLSSAGRKLKLLLISALFISSLGHISLPFATRFISPFFVYPLFVLTVSLSISIVVMSLIIIRDALRV